MQRHIYKMIAPVIIVMLTGGYYLALGGFLASELSGVLRWAALLGPAAVSLVLLAVLIERIREIRKGEEDDLGKY